MKSLYISLFLFGIVIPATLWSQAGTLDPTFGINGRVKLQVSNCGNQSSAMAIQSDGKIILAGTGNNCSGSDFSLVRLKPDGTLDSTFGTSGKVVTDFSSGSDNGASVIIQPDGKIVLGGTTSGTNTMFALARYLTNGSLDASFGTNGKVTFDLGSTANIYSIALQADGKIVAGGSIQPPVGYMDMALARFNADGTPDITFGNNGKSIKNLGPTSHEVIFTIKIQSDGKILAAGHTQLVGQPTDGFVVRYNTNGTVDSTYATGGIYLLSFGTSYDHIYAIEIQADGKAVVGGMAVAGTDDNFGLARLTVNGLLDTTFGVSGKDTTDFGIPNGDDVIYALAIQSNGKIIAAGLTIDGTNSDFSLARYNQNGTLDNTFGINGKVNTDFLTTMDNCHAVAIQPDGKIVASGGSWSGTNVIFAAARYNPGNIGMIRDNNHYFNVEIYPNPANEIINLEGTSSKGYITITDAYGKEIIFNKAGDSTTMVSTKDLSVGIYFLTYTEGENKEMKKIIVSR